jgi:KaiC/GvpD/RAD55 family RecA-like ATPase
MNYQSVRLFCFIGLVSLLGIQRISTGVEGFDELIEGGYPAGRVMLLVGGPGSGKTIFSIQFLVGAVAPEEKTLYISLDEKKEHLYREMRRFGFDLASLERSNRFVFVDGTLTMERPLQHPSTFSRFGRGDASSPLLGLIEFEVQQVHPTRIVVDPISSMALQFPDLIDRREAIVKLVNLLVSSGATCMLTSELRVRGMEHEVQLEEYLSHGVIILRSIVKERSMIRAIMIEKMRQTEIDPSPKPYKIAQKGIVVFPKESVL